MNIHRDAAGLNIEGEAGDVSFRADGQDHHSHHGYNRHHPPPQLSPPPAAVTLNVNTHGNVAGLNFEEEAGDVGFAADGQGHLYLHHNHHPYKQQQHQVQ